MVAAAAKTPVKVKLRPCTYLFAPSATINARMLYGSNRRLPQRLLTPPFCRGLSVARHPRSRTGMIAEDGGDGSLEDFAGVHLSNYKVMDKLYQKAAPGSDLNLSKDEIARFKKCKTHAEVEACLRQILLERFRAYKKLGLAGIAPYARAKKEFSPGEELRGQLKAGKLLPKHAPAFAKVKIITT